jgi:hypothetical protein
MEHMKICLPFGQCENSAPMWSIRKWSDEKRRCLVQKVFSGEKVRENEAC